MLEHTTVLDSISTQENPETGLTHQEIVRDFEICCISREASLLARKEVLTGKAKFGIIGDGKEVPQVAMARAFQKGDFRSGYYRDQTIMFALGLSSIEDFFAQLYADSDNDPFTKGRQMNSHYATALLDKNGQWLDHVEHFNISADISSTAGQMARSLGLALASKKYRERKAENGFSRHGNEVCFCTIGDASTSEGIFWETLNAAGVQGVPLSISVWDDGYGISVPIDYQTTKASISEALSGFQLDEEGRGIRIYTEKGWDYPAMLRLYRESTAHCRDTHIPALLHIQELTQPQGHSTSGSHERYKSAERLEWEREHDCIERMAQWMIESGIASPEQIDDIKKQAKKTVKQARDRAWKAFNNPTKKRWKELAAIAEDLQGDTERLQELRTELGRLMSPLVSELQQIARRLQFASAGQDSPARDRLLQWIREVDQVGAERYHTHLYSNSDQAALKVPVVPARYDDDPPLKNGFEILNAFFDKALEQHPELYAFGEDLGQIGGVNQGFAGLQAKYSEERIFDTGIREWTIMGQAIGMAMRGLRPIAEIQYLDYLIFGLEPLTDDLATVRWRSGGTQKAPAIIRTRGHRLEGIWHAGSPLGMIINSLRGMYVLVPRNMTQAAGLYNTMLQSDDPALLIECLNGYRLKEPVPNNLGEFTVPLGVPEVLRQGEDITLVTYGSCVRVAEAASDMLARKGISVELVDVQTLLPFDLEHRIAASLKKTNRILFLDEDVPGGASAFMMRQVLEVQGGYRYLDSAPATLTAHEHRPPYGSDGDYFSKPYPEEDFEAVYNIMREARPVDFPAL